MERPLLSRLFLLFMLVAFVVQGFAVQTHIHGIPTSADISITHVSAPSQPVPLDPYDPANCALCQEMLHAGVYVAPITADLAVILTAVAFAPTYALLPHAATERQHSWQGRAPPRH
ncbi:MAG: hypothetical protein ABI191_05080 [Rhizomicrobium sp.]